MDEEGDGRRVEAVMMAFIGFGARGGDPGLYTSCEKGACRTMR